MTRIIVAAHASRNRANNLGGADTADDSPRTLAQDADARTRLRREAETANVTLSLAPCQRLADFVLRRATK